MTKAQQVYREVRKHLSKQDARAFTVGIVAKPELLDRRHSEVDGMDFEDHRYNRGY